MVLLAGIDHGVVRVSALRQTCAAYPGSHWPGLEGSQSYPADFGRSSDLSREPPDIEAALHADDPPWRAPARNRCDRNVGRLT